MSESRTYEFVSERKRSEPAVSHNVTHAFVSFTQIVVVKKSIPSVDWIFSLDIPNTERINEVLPAPNSPIKQHLYFLGKSDIYEI